MTALWLAVLAASAGCYALKLLGWSMPQWVLDHPVVTAVSALLPIALLAALTAVQAVADGQHLTVDARVPGVAVAFGLLLAKRSFLVVVVCAALTTAGCRALGWG